VVAFFTGDFPRELTSPFWEKAISVDVGKNQSKEKGATGESQAFFVDALPTAKVNISLARLPDFDRVGQRTGAAEMAGCLGRFALVG